MAAISVSQEIYVPKLKKGEVEIHHWTFGEDDREVRLIKTAKDNLICQVYNKITRKFKDRVIEKFGFSTEKRIENITTKLHPELVGQPNDKICTAVFVSNEAQSIRGWNIKDHKNIDIRLLISDKGCVWVVANVIYNKVGIIKERQFSNDIIHRLQKECLLEIESDSLMTPHSVRILPYLYQWSIGSEHAVYLIREKNELYRQIISFAGEGSGGQKSPLRIPENTSTEEFIEVLKSLHPIVLTGNLKKLIFVDYIHSWNLIDGREIKLLLDGNSLKCEVTDFDGKVKIIDIDPEEGNIENHHVCLKNLNPILSDKSKIRFVKYVSQLDDQKELCGDQMAITVVNGKSKRDPHSEPYDCAYAYDLNPSSWYGHASIRMECLWGSFFNDNYKNEFSSFFVEKINECQEKLNKLISGQEDEGNINTCNKQLEKHRAQLSRLMSLQDADPVMVRAHLTDKGVKLDFVGDFKFESISGKTETWVVDRQKGIKLLDIILINQKITNPVFTITGHNSALAVTKKAFWFSAAALFTLVEALVERYLEEPEIKRAIKLHHNTCLIPFESFFRGKSPDNEGCDPLSLHHELTMLESIIYTWRFLVNKAIQENHNCISWDKRILSEIAIELQSSSNPVKSFLITTPKDFIPEHKKTGGKCI